MLVFDTQVVHFPAAPVVCYPPALDTPGACGRLAPPSLTFRPVSSQDVQSDQFSSIAGIVSRCVSFM